ncbi:MAG: hypothetical protein HOO91_07950 [Bacteroidales bacterium]|nr:hypothetical protein [Bacteroidales bacterium]
MKTGKNLPLDFEIDKLTNSIENTSTGEVFDTVVVRLTSKDLGFIHKSEWQFDWSKELKDKTKEVYKLTTVNNPTIIQGLLSIEDKEDHVFMHLIESSKFNKGKDKVYFGVPGNLVAFACKVSFDKGYEGFLVFDAKTTLIKHYQETLHATYFRGLRMFIETTAALRLISQYFKP